MRVMLAMIAMFAIAACIDNCGGAITVDAATI
jgi:hypothetical protein